LKRRPTLRDVGATGRRPGHEPRPDARRG
jgi:hypothetical protein